MASNSTDEVTASTDETKLLCVVTTGVETTAEASVEPTNSTDEVMASNVTDEVTASAEESKLLCVVFRSSSPKR